MHNVQGSVDASRLPQTCVMDVMDLRRCALYCASGKRGRRAIAFVQVAVGLLVGLQGTA